MLSFYKKIIIKILIIRHLNIIFLLRHFDRKKNLVYGHEVESIQGFATYGINKKTKLFRGIGIIFSVFQHDFQDFRSILILNLLK